MAGQSGMYGGVMKTLLPFIILAMFLSCQKEKSIERYDDQWNANDGAVGSGNSVIDKRDLKGLETSSERQEERETIRDKAAKNPRNRAFSKSFDKVDKTEEDEAEEVKELEEYREEMRDDPFIDNYGNGETTNRRLYK